MGRSWQIAIIYGIPVKLHWTLGLFFLFFVWFANKEQMNMTTVFIFFSFITALFVCILLHEFGHALTAKKYGVPTKDIILSPIGGLARLESIPNKPIQEFFVAINGPLVNLIIAGTLGLILFILGKPILPEIVNGKVNINPENYVPFLLLMNIGVFLFNLIPAFPMDGGRIFRSLLSMKIGRLRATYWAALIGRIIAVFFVIFALYNGFLILALIGPFIFITGGQEYQHVKLNQLLKTSKVSEIVRKTFTKVYNQDKIEEILDIPTSEVEMDFLVFDKETEELSGSLPHLFLKEIRKNPSSYNQIEDIKDKRIYVLDIHEPINAAFQIMDSNGVAIIAVAAENTIVGVVDRMAVSKYIATHSKVRLWI